MTTEPPDHIAFSDESGTHAGSRCFTVGALVTPAEDFHRHTAELQGILDSYQITDELKWEKIGSFRKRSEAALAGANFLLDSGVRYSAIVVDKATFVKWQKDKEGGFYHAYYELVKHIAGKIGGRVSLRMDERTDRYEKQPEVMGIIANHALARQHLPAQLVEVEKSRSHDLLLLQFADVITGAINSDTARVRAGAPMNFYKRQFAAQLAQGIGWDDLHFDTFPNSTFNVWHFPPHTRGPSRDVVRGGVVLSR